MNVRATATWTPRNSAGQFIEAIVKPAAMEAARAAAALVLERSQQIVPVDTGELKASGKIVERQTDKTVVAEIVYTAEHAAYVEFGTGQRGAGSPGAGPYPYNPNWPGMAAQPYLRPAIDESHEAIKGEFAVRLRT